MSERNLKICMNEFYYIASLPFTITRKTNEDNKYKERLLELEKSNYDLIKDNQDLIIKEDKYKEKILELEKNIYVINNLNKELLLNIYNRNKTDELEIDELKKELEELKRDENICTICYKNKINICCIPCGHTYCDICIIKSNNCYICKNNINRINRIYI